MSVILFCALCDVKIGSGPNETYAWWNARDLGAVMVGDEDFCSPCWMATPGTSSEAQYETQPRSCGRTALHAAHTQVTGHACPGVGDA